MPFKFHSKGRHHIPRQKYRVTNWREYEAALRNRGSLTIWFTDEAIASWKAQPRTSPGGQRPSVPMMMRHRPAGSLPLRAEVRRSDGYAHFE